MNITTKYNRSRGGARVIFVVAMLIFFFIGFTGYAQIDSRNQARPDREQNTQNPDKKKRKRIKSKKNPRFKGKKAYSNKKQVNKSKRNRARKVDKSPKGDITGRKVKSKKTPRTTVARPQPDPYKNRRIRTERSRAGPPAPEVRTATKKGEKARTGDISGQKRVRQRAVKTTPRPAYPQPNPYIGRTVKTEKRRAKSNKRQIQSIRSVSRPSESRKPKTVSRPMTATAAPKLRTKSQKKVYRNHDRQGGEKSTDKDITGRKLRTKNTRSANTVEGKAVISSVNPYYGRKEFKEGTRFKRSRSLPASARSISRPPESAAYRENDIYASHKNYRTPRVTGVVKAKSVRSVSQPSGRGEQPIFGKKYRPKKPRSISGYSKKRSKRGYIPPISISGNRRSYKQRNTYKGKDKHFGENSTTNDIAGRKLRTRNYRSVKPNGATSGFMPYYGRSAPQGAAKNFGYQGARSAKRAEWNNGGQPIMGRGRSANSEAISNHKGKMPLSAIAGYGRGGEGAYRGNIPAKSLRKYSGGRESVYSGKNKARKRLQGGGSISRQWNNGGQPILGRGRGANGEAASSYKGKMPLSAMPGYGSGREGSYSGKIPAKSLRKYSGGRESMYAGKTKARKRLQGGGSISRQWNNGGQPILGRGRGANGEAASSYKGKMPLSAIPGYGRGGEGSYSGNIPAKSIRKYSGGRESVYAGKNKATKRLQGGGSITRHWNNGGQPILGRGRGANGEASSNYKGKMPLSAMPSYGPGREGVYEGNAKAKRPLKGGGSITKSWNNNNQPIMGRGRGANGEAASGFQGKMPLSAMPSYGKSREGAYAGRIKAKKPVKGGGSITKFWNNNSQPIMGRGRGANGEAASGFQGKMPLSAMPSYGKSKEGVYAGRIKAKKPVKGGGSITGLWNNNNQPIMKKGRSDNGEAASEYRGSMPLSSLSGYGDGKEATYKGNIPVGSLTGYGDGREATYQGKMKSRQGKKPYATGDFIGGNASVKQQKQHHDAGIDYGKRTKLAFVYLGDEGGYMLPREQMKNYNLKGQKGKKTSVGQSPGSENGRTRSLSFLRIGNPSQGGLYPEVGKLQLNSELPRELKGTDRLRQAPSVGHQQGRSRSLTFMTIGNPTKGGLVYRPYKAKGRLHPSASYTTSNKPRNATDEKEQPIKIRIWWAKLFKKNAGQPDSVKEKTHRPRYDKGERLIWETADRPNWYDN